MALRLLKKREAEPHYSQLRRDENDYGSPGGHDESNWLVSYADMMTLLCGFFIMLFSMAKLDTPKYEEAKKEISQQFHGKYEMPPSKELAKLITEIIDQAGVKGQTVIKSDGSSVTLAFQSTLFFDSLSADVKPEGRIVLDRLIGGISSRQASSGIAYKIVVEGHTDSQPVVGGTFPSNWELSGARASRVVRMFIEKGFPSSLLTAISYGDTRPEVPSRKTDGSWDLEALAKNRRVVLRILDPKVDSIPIADEHPVVAAAPVTATPPAGSGASPVNAAAPAAAPAATAVTTMPIGVAAPPPPAVAPAASAARTPIPAPPSGDTTSAVPASSAH